MTGLREMPSPDVAPLFEPLHRELVATLRTLEPDEWNRPTVAGQWRVRDVAAHLLDGDLRKLAAHRDGHLHVPDGHAPQDYAGVVALINALNASGVGYSARLSPRLLTDLLEVTGTWVSDFITALDPAGEALFPVAWAGETVSRNWMDTGREYTERWHHQMQIRDATGRTLLLDDEWYAPLLSFSVRALPRAYAALIRDDGASVNLHIAEHRWSWSLVRERSAWQLYEGSSHAPDATVRISADGAWRIFYNAADPSRVAASIEVEGDRELAVPLMGARAVMV
jgi:hypothetical protein